MYNNNNGRWEHLIVSQEDIGEVLETGFKISDYLVNCIDAKEDIYSGLPKPRGDLLRNTV